MTIIYHFEAYWHNCGKRGTEYKLGLKKKSNKFLSFKQHKHSLKFCKVEPSPLDGMPLFSQIIDYSALQMAKPLVLLEKTSSVGGRAL